MYICAFGIRAQEAANYVWCYGRSSLSGPGLLFWQQACVSKVVSWCGMVRCGGISHLLEQCFGRIVYVLHVE